MALMAATDPTYFYQTHFLPDIIRFVHDTDRHSDRQQLLLLLFDNQHFSINILALGQQQFRRLHQAPMRTNYHY
jgi:hypothetical protein